MKVEDFDNSKERTILTNMVVSRTVLGRVASKWDHGLFPDWIGNTVGQMCVDFYKKHGEAPGRAIEGLLRLWAEKGQDESRIAMMEHFLSGLSEEYSCSDRPDPRHTIDIAGDFFNQTRQLQLAEGIKANHSLGRVDEAQRLIDSYHRVEMGAGSGEDLLIDKELVYSVFDRQEESLIKYDGDLGRFFGPMLGRDRLIAFMAPEKTGKSFFLMDLAWNAVLQRKKVAYFECGDDHEETRMRFLVRAAAHPDSSTDGEWPYIVKWPISIESPQRFGEGHEESEGLAHVEFEECGFKKALDREKAWNACVKVMTDNIKSKQSYLRLECRPSMSISVAGIRSCLESWALDDWIPSVVIIDYADILAPIDKRADKRDQINETWAAMRALTQELHVLGVTATQSNREGYGQRIIDRRHISEDKRKLAHVSGLISINRTAVDVEHQICRLSWSGRRKGAYSSRRCIYLAQCLPLACPAVLSTF